MAWSSVSASSAARGFFEELPMCSNAAARAENSPSESQRRYPSFTNCCTCLGAEPPAPVSKRPPPARSGTIDSILAEVPISRIGNRSVR